MNFRDSLISLINRQCLQTPRYGAEVGVHRGRTSVRLFHEFPRLHLYLVDSWTVAKEQTGDTLTRLSQEEQDGFYAETCQLVSRYGDRAEILRMDSVAATEFLQTLDFCFVDADHSRDGCARDIRAYWKIVKHRGILCGHDYGKEDLPGVTIAVDDFAREVAADLNVEDGSIWWMRKL